MFKQGDRVVLSSNSGPIGGVEYDGMKCTVVSQYSSTSDVQVVPDEPRWISHGYSGGPYKSEGSFFWPAKKAKRLVEEETEATDEEVRAIMLQAVNTLRQRGYEVTAQAIKTTAITYDF